MMMMMMMTMKGALEQSSRHREIETSRTLVLICGCALSVMLPTLAVVLLTPHDYSGTFQVGCSARFTASRRVPKGAKMVLYLSKTVYEENSASTSCSYDLPLRFSGLMRLRRSLNAFGMMTVRSRAFFLP